VGPAAVEGVAMMRRAFHRVTFACAAFYNVAWGLLAALDPQWSFRAAGMEPLNHPDIFRCLGMVAPGAHRRCSVFGEPVQPFHTSPWDARGHRPRLIRLPPSS